MMKKKIQKITILFLISLIISCQKDSLQYVQNTTGSGGSMARFTIVGNHLYVIDHQKLKVFDISIPSNPVYLNDFFVGRNIETIFPNPPYLFIGSANGMYIYSISNPAQPEYVSNLEHVFSCDPVVTNDTLAFVTLRSGSDCRTNSTSNQLDIIDIRSKNNPFYISSYSIQEPYGLAIDSCYVFICNGNYGLSVYDFSNPNNLQQINRINNIETYDVIPHNKILFVIGPSGFYQYDFNRIDSIFLISKINVYKR